MKYSPSQRRRTGGYERKDLSRSIILLIGRSLAVGAEMGYAKEEVGFARLLSFIRWDQSHASLIVVDVFVPKRPSGAGSKYEIIR